MLIRMLDVSGDLDVYLHAEWSAAASHQIKSRVNEPIQKAQEKKAGEWNGGGLKEMKKLHILVINWNSAYSAVMFSTLYSS